MAYHVNVMFFPCDQHFPSNLVTYVKQQKGSKHNLIAICQVSHPVLFKPIWTSTYSIKHSSFFSLRQTNDESGCKCKQVHIKLC